MIAKAYRGHSRIETHFRRYALAFSRNNLTLYGSRLAPLRTPLCPLPYRMITRSVSWEMYCTAYSKGLNANKFFTLSLRSVPMRLTRSKESHWSHIGNTTYTLPVFFFLVLSFSLSSGTRRFPIGAPCPGSLLRFLSLLFFFFSFFLRLLAFPLLPLPCPAACSFRALLCSSPFSLLFPSCFFLSFLWCSFGSNLFATWSEGCVPKPFGRGRSLSFLFLLHLLLRLNKAHPAPVHAQ